MLLFAAALPAVSPCLAQGTPSPDTAAILQAIQKLQDNLDATNKRIDKLQEGGRSAPPRAPTTAAPAPSPAPTVSRGEAQHGWLIQLEPWNEDGKSFSVASFHGPANDFNFDLHTRYNASQNRFVYHGYSTFNPKEYGEYIFQLTLKPVLLPTPNQPYAPTRFNCSGELRINGNVIISDKTDFVIGDLRPTQPVFNHRDFHGRAILEPRKDAYGHQLEHRVDCWPESHRKNTYFNTLLAAWKLNQYQIRVRGPNEMGPRPFAPEELYFVAKR